jgi:hypothetical protein
MGFEIPYLDSGNMRRYIPDFLVRLDDGGAEPLNLMLEVKGFRDEADKAKAQTMHELWVPGVNALDGYAASHRAVRELPDENEVWKDTKLRSSKYLNNMIEQDHRGIKARIGPMLGLKRFRRAKITIAGIELLHRIRKNQFVLGKLSNHTNSATEMWEAVLAA